MGIEILGFAYAATVAAGGIMGYAKAGKCFLPNYDSYQILQDWWKNWFPRLTSPTLLSATRGLLFFLLLVWSMVAPAEKQ